MSYIVDSFPSKQDAERFIERVNDIYPELQCDLFLEEQSAQEHDVFPGSQIPPVVHVERMLGDDDDLDLELGDFVELEAPRFGGVFVGT